MAQATFKSDLFLPARLTTPQASGPSFTSNLINADTKKHAFILQAPKTGNIHKILFRSNTAATADTFDVRVETVDATTGDPSGTLWGTNTNATVNVNAAGTVFTATLTADAAVTIGDIFAITWVPTAGSVSVSFCMFNDVLSGFPYTDLYGGASWTKATSAPVVGIEYSDGTYHAMPGTFPFSALNTNTYNSGSTPDERGLKFQLPCPCTVSGFWVDMDNDGDLTVKLYDSDGSTVLQSLAIDKDLRANTNYSVQLYRFAATQALLANTYYRLTLVPGASNVTSADFDVPSAAALDQIGGGQNFHHTQRTDAGAWTDTTTKRPFMGLIVNGFDDATGASVFFGVRKMVHHRRYFLKSRRRWSVQQTVNVTQVTKRKHIHPPTKFYRRRYIATFPVNNIIAITSQPVFRPRRIHVRKNVVKKMKRNFFKVDQTFQDFHIKRKRVFIPPEQALVINKPIFPQAAVTIVQNVIVHRPRHPHHVTRVAMYRRQSIMPQQVYIPRRRKRNFVPPAVIVQKAVTSIPLQTVQTDLVVSRPRKVR